MLRTRCMCMYKDAIYLKVYMTLASADYKSLNFYEEKTFAFYFFLFFLGGMWAAQTNEMSVLIVRRMETECGIRVCGAIMGIK